MKKILFIVTESKSANGICTKAIMKECVAQGYEVYCITNREANENNRYIIDGVYYYTVKPRFTYRMNKYIAMCGHNKYFESFLLLFNRLLTKTKLVLSLPTWPLISPLYADRIYRKAKYICTLFDIDYVVPVYTQIDTLLAAKRIKNKYSSIKYVPYFLDSLSGGYGPKVFSVEFSIRRGLKWEKRLLPSADRVVMMRSAYEHYAKYCFQEAYYQKILFLDLPLFTDKLLRIDSVSLLEKNVVNLVYVGSIPVSIRDPRKFFETFRLVDDCQVRLTLVGDCTVPEVLENAMRRDPRIRCHSHVEHDVALSYVRDADILVNFGNSNPRMTPSKIFEYMSYGKPIVSTAPVFDEPSIHYLNKYPCKLILDENKSVQENAKMLRNFISVYHSQRIDVSKLKDAFRDNTPEQFVKSVFGDKY